MHEIALWADIILPGDGFRWPPASEAVPDLTRLLLELQPGDVGWLQDLARNLAQCPSYQRPAFALQAERDAPAPFARSVQALYRLYYTSPAVQAVVAALANAGPREPSATFDPALIGSAGARRAGRRP